LRDRTAKIQVIFNKPETIEELKKTHIESVVEIKGKIISRKEGYENKEQELGKIEIVTEKYTLISQSQEILPIQVDEDTSKVDEQVRMEHRYLDLRTERMKKNIITRHKVNLFLRNYYDKKGFLEIETPMMTKGTPEGAREFIIPSRIYKGQFYVLPQSPQQFKQLLMVAGMQKYFQITRCFRDEDKRQDRQPEFTQLDMEMSFTNEEEIMKVMEESIIQLIKEIFPDKKIMQTPFPKITYKESIEKHGNDKPDIRTNKNERAFCWITEFPLFETTDNYVGFTSSHHPFTRPNTEDLDKLETEPLKTRSTSFDLVLNGYEIGSGSVRIHEPELQEKIFKILGLEKEETETKFGHIIKAFGYGVPPHGGIALGMDRLIATIIGEENIREVIAFPKNGEMKDLMMKAPNKIPEDTIEEIGIKIEK